MAGRGRRLPSVLCTAGMEIRLGQEEAAGRQRFAPEVVARKKVKKTQKDATSVEISKQAACSLKPAKRLNWLSTALKMAEDGRAITAEVFNIITSRRFASGVSKRLGKAMVDAVINRINTFSEKQSKHLHSPDWHLNGFLEDDDGDDPVDKDDSEDDKEASPEPCESTKASRDSPRPILQLRKQGKEVAQAFEQVGEPSSSASGWRTVERRAPFEQAKEEQKGKHAEQKSQKLEEEADASLRMLEMLSGKKDPSPEPVEQSRPSRRRRREPAEQSGGARLRSRSAHRSRRGAHRRAARRYTPSRSISISAQPRSRSDSRRRDNISYADALAERLAARERGDTTRGSIVQENYKGKQASRVRFETFERAMPQFPGSVLSKPRF